MAISVTWDGTTYSIPQAGEYNWPALTNFLVALGNKAAVADEMKQAIRKATSSPVAISATSDYAVVTDLTVAGAVTVNLPGGSPGQIFVIVDGKADAATNNITINRAGSDTIKGQPSLVMNKDRQVVMLQYNSSDSDWKVINYAIPPGQVTSGDISGTIPDSKLDTISTAGKVSGSAITSGTIAGTTAINSSGNITTSGSLSIGGNSTLGDASSDVLTINGTGVTTPNGLNIDSNTLVIDAANNRVGVGIASPTVAFDVVGAVKVSTDLTVNGNTTLGDATTDTVTIAGDATQNGTGSLKVASGTTAQRPGSPVNGMIRYNSDLTAFEGYAAGAWSGIGGGGSVDKINQASHGFVVGDVVYLNGATYTKAIATSSAAAEVVGVVSRVVDANNFELTLSGEISGLAGLTAGAVYFLSDSVAGTYSLTEPTTVGYVSVPVGIASSTTTLYVAPKRGVVVGGANARTQISLSNNATTTVQNVASYDAGELAGWVYIDATTDYRFYVQAQFVKGGNAIYNLAYQVAGDTPPAGFLVSITNAGVIQITMPSVAGFSSASINYALNAPAVGTNFPLSVDGANVTAASATTPGVVSLSNQSLGAGDKYFSGNVGIGTTSPGYKLVVKQSDEFKGLSITGAYNTNEWGMLVDGSNSLRFSYNAGGINAGEKVRIDTSGNVLINKASAGGAGTNKLQVNANSGDWYAATFENAGTSGPYGIKIEFTGSPSSPQQFIVCAMGGTNKFLVNANGDVQNVNGVYSTISDLKLKENIVDATEKLEQVCKLRVVNYSLKDNPSEKLLGFIAQEFEQVFPQMVFNNPDKDAENNDLGTVTKSIKTSVLIPMLVKAIQELKAELDAVKSELAALKK